MGPIINGSLSYGYKIKSNKKVIKRWKNWIILIKKHKKYKKLNKI